MTEFTRRKVLVSSAALGAAGLAGCVGDSDGEDEANAGAGNGEDDTDDETENASTDEDDSADSDGDSGSTEDDSQSSVTVETGNTECAQGQADSVSIDWSGDVITVTGSTPAPTPCHEAVLEDATIEADSFTIVIDVAEANEGGVCQECTGKIEYQAEIEPENPDGISDGTVRHVQGGAHGVAVESGSDETAEPTVGDSSLETIDAGCLSGERQWTVRVWRIDGGISVDGVLQAPNPCHRAVLNDVSVVDGTLTVDVGAESTLSDNEACAQCVAQVQYTASVSVSNVNGLSRVSVDHPGEETVAVDSNDIEPKGGDTPTES